MDNKRDSRILYENKRKHELDEALTFKHWILRPCVNNHALQAEEPWHHGQQTENWVILA